MIPVLLYGCENWIMTDTNISILESFQGEIGRRILHFSKFHSILSTRVALQLPSITLCIFSRKLSLLRKVHTESDSLSHKVFSVLYLLTVPVISIWFKNVSLSKRSFTVMV